MAALVLVDLLWSHPSCFFPPLPGAESALEKPNELQKMGGKGRGSPTPPKPVGELTPSSQGHPGAAGNLRSFSREHLQIPSTPVLRISHHQGTLPRSKRSVLAAHVPRKAGVYWLNWSGVEDHPH